MEINPIHLLQVNSTNEYALNHPVSLEEILFITSEKQTAGRGRSGRKWHSPKGNLYGTFCFLFPKDRKDVNRLSQLLSLAVVETLQTFGIEPIFKWPNDLLIADKKIAGILTELQNHNSNWKVACGVGLNINEKGEEYQSMSQVLGNDLDIHSVAQKLAKVFQNYLEIFFKEGFVPFSERLQQLSKSWINKTIQFHQGDSLIEGEFISLNWDGSLTLRLPSGIVKIVH